MKLNRRFANGTAIYDLIEGDHAFIISSLSYDTGKEVERLTISKAAGWVDLVELKKVVKFLEKVKELEAV